MSDCLFWTGRMSSMGYGVDGAELAHRAAWRNANGTIPDGCVVHRQVRGPMCNPSLPPGTSSPLGPIPRHMVPVGEDYLRSVGATLAATGAEVEA